MGRFASLCWIVFAGASAQGEDTKYLEESQASLQQQLQERGYAIATAIDGDVVRALQSGVDFLGETFFYDGGFFEREFKFGHGVYDVGLSNNSAFIPAHNEMASGPRSPRYIVFGCIAPGAAGGDTVLVDGHEVFAALPKSMQAELISKNVRTSLRWDDTTLSPNTTSWKASLHVDSVREGHQVAQALGHYPTWNGERRSLFAAYDYPPVITHPASGRPVLFEQIVTSHGSTLYNNDPLEDQRAYIDRLHHTWWSPGSEAEHEVYEERDEVPMELVDTLRSLEWEKAVKIKAKRGQVILVDNLWQKHGRTPFLGDRQMAVTMKGAARGSAQPLQRPSGTHKQATDKPLPSSATSGTQCDRSNAKVWKLKVELAAAYRLLDKHKMNEGVWNHLTVAVGASLDQFLVPKKGLSWSLMKPDDMLLVDSQGRVLDGAGTADDVDISALTIHAAVHDACGANGVAVFHLHPPWSTTMCAMSSNSGGRLLQVHQNCARFFNAVAYDDRFNGISESFAEGQAIARKFNESGQGGDRCKRVRVLFLANHGVIVVAPTIAAAWDDTFYLERASQLQVQALMAVGGDVSRLNLINDTIAEMTYQQTVGQAVDVGYAEMHLAAGISELRAADPSFGYKYE